MHTKRMARNESLGGGERPTLQQGVMEGRCSALLLKLVVVDTLYTITYFPLLGNGLEILQQGIYQRSPSMRSAHVLNGPSNPMYDAMLTTSNMNVGNGWTHTGHCDQAPPTNHTNDRSRRGGSCKCVVLFRLKLRNVQARSLVYKL